MSACAVVLDFDGTICRSMALHAQAYRHVLAPFGLAPTDREIFLLEGARSETIIAESVRSVDPDATTEEIKRLADAKQRKFAELGPAPLYAGAKDLVRALHEATDHLALVTGTRRENLDRIIPDLVPLFNVILAQDGYTHDKPHPEPYQKAAERLGVHPKRCAALENAVRGIKSARAAGYGFVVAITTTLTTADLGEGVPDRIVDGHDEARRVILEWLEEDRRVK